MLTLGRSVTENGFGIWIKTQIRQDSRTLMGFGVWDGAEVTMQVAPDPTDEPKLYSTFITDENNPEKIIQDKPCCYINGADSCWVRYQLKKAGPDTNLTICLTA